MQDAPSAYGAEYCTVHMRRYPLHSTAGRTASHGVQPCSPRARLTERVRPGAAELAWDAANARAMAMPPVRPCHERSSCCV